MRTFRSPAFRGVDVHHRRLHRFRNFDKALSAHPGEEGLGSRRDGSGEGNGGGIGNRMAVGKPSQVGRDDQPDRHAGRQ